jgi:hypothetical protein
VVLCVESIFLSECLLWPNQLSNSVLLCITRSGDTFYQGLALIYAYLQLIFNFMSTLQACTNLYRRRLALNLAMKS